jgi:deazaflavin-dependent oxidoreductase (nitroreductase family)
VPTNVKLTTIGRKSGEPRRVTLYAFEDGDGLVVVGSLGGAANDPVWAGNLRANPTATVRVDGEPRTVRAREVEGDERERLWRLVVDGFPTYATYQRKTKRQFPLFVLEPSPKSGNGQS